jgi:hypothetical protein
VEEPRLEAVEREVAPPDLEVRLVRLEGDDATAGGSGEPEPVVGPPRPQLDHRRLRLGLRDALHDGVEGELLLRLVVAAKRADDLGHPGPVVAAFDDHEAVVHALQALPVLLEDLAGAGDLGDRIRVAAGGGHDDPPRNVDTEVVEA